MVAHRRKDLVVSRRRVEDEGEEEGSVAAELDDDSLSEGSGLSDEEDEYGDADGSDISGDSPASPRMSEKPSVGANGHSKTLNGVQDQKPSHSTAVTSEPVTRAMTDTQAMMNGLNISEQSENVEEIQFDEMTEDTSASAKARPQPTVMGTKNETAFEKRKREHDEYRKQRDTDPAFVPNRGGFFMHDHRHAGPGQNGFKPFGRGRGRGRGAVGGPFSPSKYVSYRNWLVYQTTTNFSLVAKPRKPTNLLMHHGPMICTKPWSSQPRGLHSQHLLLLVQRRVQSRTLRQVLYRRICQTLLDSRPPIGPSRGVRRLAVCKSASI